MNKFAFCLVNVSLLLFLSGCTNTVAPVTDDRVMYVSNATTHTEPYWSNHFFDTGYGYHNMGYWGVGSWDIGTFRNNRDPI